jgi:predicted permease
VIQKNWLDNLRHDVRYALRNYRRQPVFATAVIGLTALGIGATTAVFSVVDRVLFRDMPYSNSGRLVSLGIRIPWLEYDFLTAGSYKALLRDPGPLSAATSWAGVGDCDLTGDRPARLSCATAESSFLSLLGVRPILGRNFTHEEDLPDVPRVALLSYALWQNRFAGDRGIVGRKVDLDGRPTLIVGVLPADFELPSLDPVDLLIPQALPPNLPPGSRPLRVYARLHDGVGIAQAREALLARAATLFMEVPPHMRGQVQFHVRSLRDVRSGDFRAASWTLLAAVFAMLSIACANVANLLLARSAMRRQEFAIRVALGAGRLRMMQQTLTETLLLSVAGGAAGCLLAYVLLKLFIAIAPSGIPHLTMASLDLRVLLFGIALSVLCGVAFGILPAWYAPKARMLAGSRTTGSMSLLARRLLVGTQLAVSMILLTCSGILLQSLWQRQAVSLGMHVDRVVTAQVTLGSRYAQTAVRGAFYEQLEARVRRLPGVESVALSDSLPPGGTPRSQPIFALTVLGKPAFDSNTPRIVIWRAVTPDYFRTLGIPILRGRTFTEDDRRPAARSIIISDSYARRLFGSDDPLGQSISRFPGDASHPPPWYTIVGVAADARNAGLTDDNNPEYYLARRHGFPAYEDAPVSSAVILQGSASAEAMEGWLRSEIAALDPAVPPVIRTFQKHVGELAARPRFQAWLLTLFASIGLLLAAAGVYGLVAFLVAQREREIGVRLALGATRAGIVRMILGEALRWTTAGLLVGLAGAAAATRSLSGLLFHVSPADPWAYAAAVLLLTVLGLAAAFVPSRRAARMDPAIALRQE